MSVVWAGLLAVGAGPATGDDDAALRAAVAAERDRPLPPRLPREQFLAPPTLGQATLSPTGSHLAWLALEKGEASVWLQDLPNGPPRLLLARSGAAELAWSRDGRWLLLADDRRLAAVPAEGPGGGALSALGGMSRRVFVGVDPVHAAAALVLERPPLDPARGGRWRVLRLDLDGGERVLAEDARRIVDLALDARGDPAWLMLAEADAHVLYRIDDAGERVRLLRCGDLRRCRLVGVSPAGGAWIRGNPAGDLHGLWHIDRGGRLRRLHQDPAAEADLADLVVDPVDARPRLLGYRSTVPSLHALEADDRARLAAIRARLRGHDLRVEIGGADWLVHERADTLRGQRWWLADARGGLREVLGGGSAAPGGEAVPRPDEAHMARNLPIRWRASDGRLLHGFVMLPPGREAAQAPMVVLVHGGPHGQAHPGYDGDAQLLANRGYVVFQPNFRGSTGLGREYLRAARGDFGNGRVLADIVEGTQWLLARGVGDARRVGIAGASFGGYAALLGVSHAPALFRVAVAAVPPADFGRVMRDFLGSGHEMYPGIPMADSLRLLGADPADPALMRRLAEQSPLANAAALQRPVLLLAGGEDARVPIRGVTHYAATLQTLGKDVSLFVDPRAGHAIADDRSREAYVFLMEVLLHARLGGLPAEPASPALRAHLQRHLLLRGSDLQDLPGRTARDFSAATAAAGAATVPR